MKRIDQFSRGERAFFFLGGNNHSRIGEIMKELDVSRDSGMSHNVHLGGCLRRHGMVEARTHVGDGKALKHMSTTF